MRTWTPAVVLAAAVSLSACAGSLGLEPSEQLEQQLPAAEADPDG